MGSKTMRRAGNTRQDPDLSTLRKYYDPNPNMLDRVLPITLLLTQNLCKPTSISLNAFLGGLNETIHSKCLIQCMLNINYIVSF